MGHGMVTHGTNKDKLVSRFPVWHQGWGTDVSLSGKLLTPNRAKEIALPWEAIEAPVYLNAGDGNWLVCPYNKAVVRNDLDTNDPNRILGIVGKGYPIFANQEITDTANAMTDYAECVETCGSLHGGRRVYMCIKLGGKVHVIDDEIAQYLILTTAHDSTAASLIFMAPVRVVCQNTLSMAINSKSCYFKIPHTKNWEERLKAAMKAMEKATSYFTDHATVLRNLAAIKVSKKQAREYFERVIKTSEKDEAEAETVKKDGKAKKKNSTRSDNVILRLEKLFFEEQDGAKQKATNGTAYGLVNAVTQWLERERSTRVHGQTEDEAANAIIERDNRIESILFTSGAKIREKAMQLAIAMN